ncbi:helix-turn-helix domain-containing protein [Microbispora sp. KK1-11]|uniref:winged helix-turn-helix transcriptional regulator n=1 Tax=Microbispora sp. KK1-11 TaxID=2053005 RepID=UPI00115C294C|nr:helix-turn-helix domain-containing protein [Microbispora sp. KK1-11]TQS27110.1 helix-turn-helix transcriptional regulator [Microbispora sp. KK1-11]
MAARSSDGDTRREWVPAVLAARDDTTCRVREVLDRVGEKWAVTVIAELGRKPRRYNELRRAIPGVSQRMLTATLRGLERDGLVRRTVHPVVPPRVDYELTPLGGTLLDTVSALLDWAVKHIDDVDGARAEYDGRQEVAAPG